MAKRKDSLQLYGTITGEDVAGLHHRVRELLASRSRKVLRVSAADLEYIGVAGLQILLAATRCIRERGGDVELVGDTSRLQRSLDLAGLSGALRPAERT